MRPVDGVAFDMPARQAGELEIIMGVRCLGHLSQAKIDPFAEKDVQQLDLVPAGRICSQMGEGIGEASTSWCFMRSISDADHR